MLFRPPPRVVDRPVAEEGGEASKPTEVPELRWVPGALVERLLDDISDIWAGAVVLAARRGDLYDVEYADDGVVECDVEGSELRRRTVELSLPVDVWMRTGCCLSDKLELCALECLARSPHSAAQQAAQIWWCGAFHQRFGRCGWQCEFASLAALADTSVADQQEATRKCFASTGSASLWKERYITRERHNAPSATDWAEARANHAYATSGKAVSYSHIDGRLRYGSNNVGDMFFDPRLGCMVSDGR